SFAFVDDLVLFAGGSRLAVGVGVAISAARLEGVLDPEGVLAGHRIVAGGALGTPCVHQRPGVGVGRVLVAELGLAAELGGAGGQVVDVDEARNPLGQGGV